MAPDGSDLQTALFVPEAAIASGRLSPDGRRLAYSFIPPGGNKTELWLLDASGKTQKLADHAGRVTAWSPDGTSVSYHRESPNSTDEHPVWESFTFDVNAKQEHALPLPNDYWAEDWHPKDNMRLLVYTNARNWIYREKRGDSYPVRQLDLLAAGGQRSPISKDPSFDNILPRFSPTGERIAHYRRRFEDERPKEFAAVCAPDGSGATEVFGFTDRAIADKLFWFRPQGHPSWSPNASEIAWLVVTHDREAVSASKAMRMRKLALVFIPVAGGQPRMLSLSDKGVSSVMEIDWR
jgi:Tol biopolymer transport system component